MMPKGGGIQDSDHKQPVHFPIFSLTAAFHLPFPPRSHLVSEEED